MTAPAFLPSVRDQVELVLDGLRLGLGWEDLRLRDPAMTGARYFRVVRLLDGLGRLRPLLHGPPEST